MAAEVVNLLCLTTATNKATNQEQQPQQSRCYHQFKWSKVTVAGLCSHKKAVNNAIGLNDRVECRSKFLSSYIVHCDAMEMLNQNHGVRMLLTVVLLVKRLWMIFRVLWLHLSTVMLPQLSWRMFYHGKP